MQQKGRQECKLSQQRERASEDLSRGGERDTLGMSRKGFTIRIFDCTDIVGFDTCLSGDRRGQQRFSVILP